MPSLFFWLLVFAFILCVLPSSAYAFGAGNLPSYGYLENRAFRHGDIEDVLAELLKRTTGGLIKKGGKFHGLDIKRVYFGNWLRDYSQAVDVAGLKATSIQNILTIVMVLGFLAHGYVTEEFEATEERLGVYLPVEHIDNPKGYPSDARNFHPKLRPPVNPRELEIDLRTGMKNYIANEDGGWDTSKTLVRRRLEECVQIGRRYRQTKRKADQYEAFRLLGTALHTLEDFPAHSNFCELSLISQGHLQVFPHVGDQVRILAPNGKMVPPLVTGTFGGDDFYHSLLGEAGDHISQASISDLNAEIEKAKAKGAKSNGVGSVGQIRSLFDSIPGEGQSMRGDLDRMQSTRENRDPNTMTAKELYQNIWTVLVFRDTIVKKISFVIDKIPGLGPLIEAIMENITVFVFTTLEPFLKPLMKTATTQLANSAAEIINKIDQYEVFNDPQASDPTHSMLSKDHFNLILNEPAGNLAKLIVTHVVKLVVHAWDNPGDDVRYVTETAMECLFHPDFHNPNSAIQKEMLAYMLKWISEHPKGNQDVVSRLSKESVRSHTNIRRPGDGGETTVADGTFGHGIAVGYGHQVQGAIHSELHNIPGVSQVSNAMGSVGIGGTPHQGREIGPGMSTTPGYHTSGSGVGMPGPGAPYNFPVARGLHQHSDSDSDSDDNHHGRGDRKERRERREHERMEKRERREHEKMEKKEEKHRHHAHEPIGNYPGAAYNASAPGYPPPSHRGSLGPHSPPAGPPPPGMPSGPSFPSPPPFPGGAPSFPGGPPPPGFGNPPYGAPPFGSPGPGYPGGPGYMPPAGPPPPGSMPPPPGPPGYPGYPAGPPMPGYGSPPPQQYPPGPPGPPYGAQPPYGRW